MRGNERPCCFYRALDWDGTRPIAKTVIPWLMSWLLDYEFWLATGHWHGGGIHTTVGSVPKKWLKRKTRCGFPRSSTASPSRSFIALRWPLPGLAAAVADPEEIAETGRPRAR